MIPGELRDLIPDVENGRIPSPETCRRLLKTEDLTGLGKLANRVRERLSGKKTFYRPAIHLHLADIPVPHCPYCEGQRQAGKTVCTLQEWDRAPQGDLELHLSGIGESGLSLDRICRMIRQSAGRRVGMRMFTAGDLDFFARTEGVKRGDVLKKLAEAGLNSLAGGGRIDLAIGGLHSDDWAIEDLALLMRSCASLDLQAELVWICRNPEELEEISSVLSAIRSLQDQWSVINCFTPLLSRPPGSTPSPTACDQMRALAVSRLILDNIPHIRISPAALTGSMLQIGQWYGADDIGAAAHPAWKMSEGNPSPDEVALMIREAGREPVDALALPQSSGEDQSNQAEAEK